MCGVFGVINANASLAVDALRAAGDDLLLESESRGSEAAGLAVWTDGGLTIHKSGAAPRSFVKERRVDEMFARIDHPDTGVVIGHSRMVTNGSAIFDHNNQPASAAGVTLVHNGIVTNYDHLTDDEGESDTVAIAQHLAACRADGASISVAVQQFFAQLVGAATIAVIDEVSDTLVLATNTGSLYVAWDAAHNPVGFASERRIMDAALRRRGGRQLPVSRVEKLPAGSGLGVDRRTGRARKLSLPSATTLHDDHHRGVTPVRSAVRPVRPVDSDPPPFLTASIERTRQFADSVRRCRRCILPETFPFLDFDESGVCSQCRTYQPIEVRPIDELEAVLSTLRSGGDEPNCILAFSGGRDSAYGLHLLVREYGVRPITLTYDWGMVTDLARRNQARMTGALGVEHVLISADIARKRQNIGRNLRAWMKDPDLGMVPLLMAGDKQFFLHARKLSKDLAIPLVIFCVNPLEMTYFKSGFAGVRDQRYYTSSTLGSRARQMGYYASRYLRNPAYFNRSLWDTAEATWATYGRSHDYLQFFEWVAWDEDDVNATLIDEYGWETDPTTTTTWRIGDGTAPFYNYVYWRAVGFTENDTFRANQVREGQITRERALELAMAENDPRWSRIREYLELVEVDFDDAMAAIERLAGSSPVGA